MTDLTLTVDKTIHASIEKVFDAWLDPEMLSQFMMPMPGMPASDVENDAREEEVLQLLCMLVMTDYLIQESI